MNLYRALLLVACLVLGAVAVLPPAAGARVLNLNTRGP